MATNISSEKIFEIGEISIVVVAANHNPTILNPDFLLFNSIVPEDWELAEHPLCTIPLAQVVYKNGFKIISQLEKVIFSESLQDKRLEESNVSSIAKKYAEKLPHVNYTAVGINPTGHIVFNTREELQAYILRTFFTPSPWKQFKGGPREASCKFSYQLDTTKFNLTIEERALNVFEDQSLPVLAISANFHHEITASNPNDNLQMLVEILDNWLNDVQIYTEFVTAFLIP